MGAGADRGAGSATVVETDSVEQRKGVSAVMHMVSDGGATSAAVETGELEVAVARAGADSAVILASMEKGEREVPIGMKGAYVNECPSELVIVRSCLLSE